MEIIRLDQNERWNTIIKSFSDWDIYYLSEYAESFRIHGDGEPILIYMSFAERRMAYIMMQNDIAEFGAFKGVLEKKRYFDWTTPYGYGGPLYDGGITVEWMEMAMKEVEDYAKRHGIVSQFFRYHPLLQNQKHMEAVGKVLYPKKTVYIDTQSKELILKNMTPNNRNMVRKAQKNGVEIIMDKGERIAEFIDIYNKTMQKHDADDYYYFEPAYFDYIKDKLYKNMFILYALYEGKVISASIFFYNHQYMHYHLSGTLPEYRNLAAANLLLTEAANWAAGQGIRYFHLGGGVDEEDSLLRFKKHFNREGLIDFCIGSNIFDEDAFKMLVQLRAEVDDTFDVNKPFMIKYRG